jgi:hypothetical protein
MQQIKTSGTKLETKGDDVEMKKPSSTFVETVVGQVVGHLSIYKTDDSVLQLMAGRLAVLVSDKPDKTDFPFGTQFFSLILSRWPAKITAGLHTEHVIQDF